MKRVKLLQRLAGLLCFESDYVIIDNDIYNDYVYLVIIINNKSLINKG